MNKKQDIIRGYLNCTCDAAYKSRRLTDPDCFLCEYESEIELMMQEYHEEQLKIQNIPIVIKSVCPECKEPHRTDNKTTEQICLNCGNGWQTVL